ncbi:MAG TPA: hypothetical protein VEK56_01235 [Vicinamibacterales bacterium]|nr:hypothetical protein [Vicinamibacterales bacterium]
MKRLLIAVWVLLAFAAGIAAERLANGVTMRGKVMDANTIAEAIEYWEVRSPTGESVVITGRNDMPIMKWLRQAKNRSVVVSLDFSPDVSASDAAR